MHFLTDWYGKPQRGAPTAPPSDVPEPLAEWHEAVARWGFPLTAQNRMLNPPELDEPTRMVVFYLENQAVYEWAYPAGSGRSSNPEVFLRERDIRAAWSPTGACLDEFLVQAAMFEAISGAAIGASSVDITPAQLATLVKLLTPIAMTPWTWPAPDHRLYRGDGILVFAGLNGATDHHYEVFVGAKSNDRLEFLDGLGIDWDHSSRAI